MAELALAGAATLAGALVQSAAGFGFALVLSPVLFAVFDPYEAITAVIVLSLLLNLLVLFGNGGPSAVPWRMLAPVLLAAVPGLVVGVALLELLSKPTLQVAVGLCVIIAALLAASERAEVRSAFGVGLASGTLTTSTSVSGPPIVLWLHAHRLSPERFKATLAASFLTLNVAGGVVLVAAGGTGQIVSLGVLGLLLAFGIAGHVAGLLVFRRIDGERFRGIVLALVAVTGAASVGAGLAAI